MAGNLRERMDRLDRAYRMREAARSIGPGDGSLRRSTEDEVALAERLVAMTAPCDGGEAARLLHFCAGRLTDPALQSLLVRAAHRLSTDPDL